MSEIEFLQLKGIRKANQLHKRYNLSIAEMIEFLHEYTTIKLKEKTPRIISLNTNPKIANVR
jgi:hypothetical protein